MDNGLKLLSDEEMLTHEERQVLFHLRLPRGEVDLWREPDGSATACYRGDEYPLS